MPAQREVKTLETREAEITALMDLVQTQLNELVESSKAQELLYVRISDVNRDGGDDAKIVIQAPPHTCLGETHVLRCGPPSGRRQQWRTAIVCCAAHGSPLRMPTLVFLAPRALPWRALTHADVPDPEEDTGSALR